MVLAMILGNIVLRGKCNSVKASEALSRAISYREDGVVLIDSGKSKGKKELVDSCPYGAIYWHEEKEIP